MVTGVQTCALPIYYPQMARLELSKWFDTEIVEHLIDGLRKAGLDVTNNEGQVV